MKYYKVFGLWYCEIKGPLRLALSYSPSRKEAIEMAIEMVAEQQLKG